MNNLQVTQIAKRFSELLEKEIGAVRMGRIAYKQRLYPDKNYCYSHDYCDANMVIAAAFESVMNRAPVISGERNEDMELMVNAWDEARKNLFYQG